MFISLCNTDPDGSHTTSVPGHKTCSEMESLELQEVFPETEDIGEDNTTKDDRKKYGTVAHHYTQGVDVTTECIHIRFSKNDFTVYQNI